MAFLRFFRRLQWKLTASYTLVTVAALLVVELLLLIVGLVILQRAAHEIPPEIASAMSERLAPRAAPYLAGEAPDLAGLHDWLAGAGRVTISLGGVDASSASFDLTDQLGSNLRLLVLDRGGQLLGQSGQSAPPAAAERFDLSTVPGLAALLPEALAGDDTGDRYARNSRSLTVAVPVRDGAGGVVGALVLTAPFGPGEAIRAGSAALVALLAAVLLLFTVTAGLIGTLFGFFTARGLTRRLERVSAATAAWGVGDFSRVIRDRSGDEIGQLGRQLNRMAAQLEGLIRTRQELSALDERNRLARDLHDSVKQQVFAISMNLGAAQTLLEADADAARGRLEAASALARQSQGDLTNIIQALRPAQLEGKGLELALAEEVRRFGEGTGIVASLEARGVGTLPLTTEEALFRIVQEALANVARHSRATQVLVTLEIGGGEVVLTVEDNGHGFDTRRHPAGVGLGSMRERAEATGGSLHVASSPRGAVVTARAPVAGLP